ncbi:hypothetical protein [Naasia sp. SYSU D00057]|uniref:hypothetical protein n=1 Tax=Naasia sp. SYSU D00057 TaxID=2817380 RepID=UPI001B306BAE|nr:hypothetical protein [Naasia sp. SYSU D00057]
MTIDLPSGAPEAVPAGRLEPLVRRIQRRDERERSGGTGSAAGRRLPVVLALAIGTGTALLGAGSLPGAALLLLVLLVVAASGASLWVLVTGRRDPLELAFAGLLLGLGLLGAGTVLAGYAGALPTRWLPTLLGLAAWIPALRRRRATVRRTRSGWEVWGIVAAQVLLLPSLLGMLAAAPLEWDGWRRFYVDVPWHLGFVAEGIDRAPAVYPYVADLSLGYTWLFNGALAGLGQLTGASAAQLALHVAPALMTAALPTIVATAARAVTRSRLAVLLAPLVLLVAHAPFFSFLPGMEITPQWLMSNRDFSHLTALLVVAVALLGRPLGTGGLRWLPSWSLLLLTAFAAAGAKGSALPMLAGAFGLVALVALLTRQAMARRIGDAVAVATGILLAQFGVTKSTAYLGLDPLSFFNGQVPAGKTGLALVLATVAVLAALVAFVALTALAARELRAPLLYAVGGGTAGLMFLVLPGHPGLSQLYFVHAVWPLLVVAIVAALVRWSRPYPLYLPAIGLASAAVALLLTAPPEAGRLPWAMGVFALAGFAALAGVVPVLPGLLRRGARPAVAVATVGAALLGGGFALQNWGAPFVQLAASTPSVEDDSGAVSGEQVKALHALRDASDPTDLVMTNKHCLTGGVAAGDCDPRWFAVAALAERRVLVEGFSYTRLSEGVPFEDEYWDPRLLAENDAFLTDPDAQSCRAFADRGVRWVYLDKRLPYSSQLAQYGRAVADNGDAAVYELTCSSSESLG